MTDFKDLTAAEFVERILEIEHPLLVMHENPDADTVGSSAALAEIFSMLGRRTKYICSDEIPKRLEFLLEPLERAESLQGLSPIAVDIASRSMLGKCRDILTGDLTPVLMIDHHEIGEPFADCYKIPGASSVGEVMFGIAQLLCDMGKIKFTPALASYIFAAMSSDTGAFRYSNATAATYEKASRLISLGADHARISHLLFFSKTESKIRAEGITATKMRTAFDGKVAYSSISNRELEREGLDRLDFDTGIDVVRSLLGVEIALFAKETEKGGNFKVSLRSTDADVSIIAASLGGGGHVRAAGCTVAAESADEAIGIVLEKIKEICK